MRIAGQRAKQDDTQVRSSSGDEAAAELAVGIDEGNKAGFIDWFKFATISQNPVKELVTSGVGGAEDLKLLLRVQEPAVHTVFWVEKTVAEGINNNQTVQTRQLIRRESVFQLLG